MDQKHPETAPHHEGGDPASLQQDPAQVYPTGGAGLLDPRNDPARDIGGPAELDNNQPTKSRPSPSTKESVP